MGTCTLAGPALIAESRRLAIAGRSRMSADELREAIGAATVGDQEGSPDVWDTLGAALADYVSAVRDANGPMVDRCDDTACTVCPPVPTPLRFAPWHSPRGKHKRSDIRRRTA